MGILSDLFKSSKNWTVVELQCIMQMMAAMGQADGEFDEQEKLAAINIINGLPGASVRDWEHFMSETAKMSPEMCFDILKNMHSKKQRLALACVGFIAQADGEIDDVENEFFGDIATALGIEL